MLVVALIVVIVTVGIVSWHNNANAQQPRQFGRRQDDRQMPMSRFPSPEAPAICAAGDYVYVVAGSTLYQFNAADLKIVNKSPIEIEPRPRPGRPGGMEEQFPPSRRIPRTEEDK